MKNIALIPAVLLAACTSYPELVDRETDQASFDYSALSVMDSGHNCAVIEHIAADAPVGTRKGREEQAAISRAHARAVEAGANAIFFEEIHSKLWGDTVLASALKCEEADLNRVALLNLSSDP